jgi:hypothetical protein
MRQRMPGATLATAIGLAALLGTASPRAATLTYGFSHDGYDFGSVTVSTHAGRPGDLFVRVDGPAGQPGGHPDSDIQITGVAFRFDPVQGTSPNVGNPAATAHAGDLDARNWRKATNLNAIPQPSNSLTVRKDDFQFAATTGRNGFTPPGVGAGEYDMFIIGNFNLPNAFFSPGTWENLDLATFVDHIGLRIQGIHLPGSPEPVTSLFLVGAPAPAGGPVGIQAVPVPEPTGLVLFGSAMLALRLLRDRRRR